MQDNHNNSNNKKRKNHDKNRYNNIARRNNDCCDHCDGYIRYARRYGRKYKGDVYMMVVRLYEIYLFKKLLKGHNIEFNDFNICVKQVWNKYKNRYEPKLTLIPTHRLKFMAKCYHIIPSATLENALKEIKDIEYIIEKK